MQDSYPGTGRVDLGSRSKSEVITIRINPKVKFGLEIMARHNNASVAQMVETAIYRMLKDPFNNSRYIHDDFDPSIINKLWSPHRGERLLRMVFEHPELLSYEEEVVWNNMAREGVFDGYLEPPLDLSSRPLPDADLHALEDRIASFLDALDAAEREEAEKKKKAKKKA
ncbi:MAG TPA: hypothetical protein PK725_08525 [Rhodocyclaceae bacterium]|nr:hypothetical protein [Rhodocyclaceae bacterium]